MGEPTPARPAALLLDVGGVLLLPHRDEIASGLRAAGVTWTGQVDPLVAHYRGTAALDAAVSGSTWVDRAPDPYVAGWLDALEVTGDRDAAAAALHDILSLEALRLWRQVTPWARSGLAACAAAPVRLGVVSNADGTVEEQLRDHELAQVGPGPGTPVEVVVDSAVVGVAKPDPAVFTHALEPLGLEPAQAWYVGDTVTYDVAGARAAGLRAIHLDPHGWCPVPDDHAHVAELDAVAAMLDHGRDQGS